MSNQSGTKKEATGRLRLLTTTDLHMQLLGYDYFADCADDTIGLLHLAGLIDALRQGRDTTTLLLDNGDLLQGNPMADHLAEGPEAGTAHPMIAALNLLGYDAMTLGNHDFDYGIPFLQRALAHADFPVVSANIFTPGIDALSQPFALLQRHMTCDDGEQRPIRIGITGFGPPQIADWDEKQRSGQIAVRDIVDAAQDVVPRMQAAGADVIIALAHTGIGAHDAAPRMENAAVPLAAVAGIDVVITGHTHGRFPNADHAITGPVDPLAGTLHNKPAIMAEAYGKALGVIDLTLSHTAKGWHISAHDCALRRPQKPLASDSPLQRRLLALAKDAHDTTLIQMRQPIAQTGQTVQSYFATVAPDLPQQILGQALRDAVQDALPDATADIPVLAATSPFRFGGQSGLGQYVVIPPGPITLHDVAAIFPFNDNLYAVRRSGAQIRHWLEKAASHYNQILPGTSGTALINPQSAGYRCDTLHGLRYQVDLSLPGQFDQTGNVTNPQVRRITQLEHNGVPVGDDDQFIVATNSFRAKGGGGFSAIPATDLLPLPPLKIRDVLTAALSDGPAPDARIAPVWRFASHPDTRAEFVGATAARAHLPDKIAWLADISDTEARYQITF